MHYVSKVRMRPAAVLLTPSEPIHERARPSWAARLMLAMLGLTPPKGEAS
ncbi:hypothetical protein [Brevundimonas sp. Leaf363]|nr:hypothetical protein [Brevundimonas sp. Leaf363]